MVLLFKSSAFFFVFQLLGLRAVRRHSDFLLCVMCIISSNFFMINVGAILKGFSEDGPTSLVKGACGDEYCNRGYLGSAQFTFMLIRIRS